MKLYNKINFLVFSIFLVFNLKAQPDIKFLHFSIEEGLSQVTCNGLIQDSRGFIWVGTQDGLNRFDGYDFKIFRHLPGINTSISDNYIWCLLEDKNKNIWVGTRGGGLNIFDYKTNTFKHYKNDKANPNSLSNDFVRSIFEDNKGNLWIGTEDGLNLFNHQNNSFIIFQDKNSKNTIQEANSNLKGLIVYSINQDDQGNILIGTEKGLNIYNPKSKTFSYQQHKNDKPNSLSHNIVKSIHITKSGKIWIGTDGGGLNLFNPLTKSFTRYIKEEKNPKSLSHNSVYSILEDRKGNLWVGTLGGLNLLNKKNNTFTHYLHQENISTSISNNFIYSLLEDQKGNLWVGTYIQGLNLYDYKVGTFEHYKIQQSDPYSLNNNNIRTIHKDKSGNLWVGTQSGGVNFLDSKTGKFTHYVHDENNPGSLSYNFTRIISEDKDGNILIGMHGGGLNVFDRKLKTFKHYKHNPNDEFSISGDIIFGLLVDSKGRIWVGNYGGGLDLFDIENERFYSYKVENNAPFNFVMSLAEDEKGQIWVGTMGGLGLLNTETKEYKIYSNNSQNPKSISHNSVNQISIDQEGIIWIASYGGGINRFDPETETFTSFRQSDGILPTDGCSCIFSDKRGFKWISTVNGFLRFNPKTKEVYRYDDHHGLQGKGFNVASCHKDYDGKLYFGGINGFNTFHPDSINQSDFKPNVVITDFMLFNKMVLLRHEINDEVSNDIIYMLDHDISVTEKIILPHDAYVLSFQYASLDIGVSDHNSYMYKLEGFDKDWNYIAQKRETTYTNLPFGEYTFRVKGTNSDGRWSDKEASLKLIINPPPYLTIWAKLLYLTIIISLIIWFIKSQRENVIKKEIELQKERKALEEEKAISEKLEELNREKDGMINIVAHDLKSPLNKLSGFLQLIPMVGTLNPEQLDFTKKMEGIIRQGSKLIKNLLDINYLEHNNLKTDIKNVNLNEFIPIWVSYYMQEVKRKKQNLHVEIESDKLQLHTDKEVLSRILDNLLTNAIKFTAQEKNIYFKAYQEENMVLFSVKDEGPGITQIDQKKMFKKFQRLSAQPTGGESSSGLGLSIIKLLTEKLDGKIIVNSEVGVGTEFIVKFGTLQNNEHNND